MKTIFQSTIILVATLTIAMCGKQDHSSMNSDKTKIVVVKPIQFAIELVTTEEHHKMMKDMNMKVMMDDQSDHTIMVTLADKEKKQVIKNAAVTIDVVGPDKKTQNGKIHTMSGEGMHHYSAGFMMKDTGMYKVKVKAVIDGKDYQAETMFSK